MKIEQRTVTEQDGDSFVMISNQIDVHRPDHVEVILSKDKKKMWVNVCGVCVFSAYSIQNLHIEVSEEDNNATS